MEKKEVLLLLDDVLELPPGALQGHESIKDWDSIAVIGLIALADEKFNVSFSSSQITNAKTVNDIVNLLLSLDSQK